VLILVLALGAFLHPPPALHPLTVAARRRCRRLSAEVLQPPLLTTVVMIRTANVSRNRKQSMALHLLQRRSTVVMSPLRRQTLVSAKRSVEIRLSDMSSASEIDRGAFALDPSACFLCNRKWRSSESGWWAFKLRIGRHVRCCGDFLTGERKCWFV
jgi:hypothetical protein